MRCVTVPRSPAPFSQQTVTRALRATKAAGISVARIEIDREGKIVIVTGSPAPAQAIEAALTQEEMLDKELAEFEALHGAGGD